MQLQKSLIKNNNVSPNIQHIPFAKQCSDHMCLHTCIMIEECMKGMVAKGRNKIC